MVFSWSNTKPTVRGRGDSETYSLSVHDEKASASVNLLGGLPNAPDIPDSAEEFTVAVSDVSMIAVICAWLIISYAYFF